jgi:hypothetical protein
MLNFRILWFFRYSQNCESFKEAKQATQRLVHLENWEYAVFERSTYYKIHPHT